MEKIPFKPEIETDRLILKQRKLTFKRAQTLSELIQKNRDYLAKWMPWALRSNTPEDCYASALGSVEKWDEMLTADYLIYDQSLKMMGSISMKDVNYDVGSGEIGYWIGEEFTGKGYMTEAVYSLENEFFNRGMERVELQIDSLNVASLNVADRCGYREEGTLRHNAWNAAHTKYRDTKILSKLRAEWVKQRD